MTLREQITTDVSAVFLNTDDFAETVTYTPKSGDARQVSAVVDESERYEEGVRGGKRKVTVLEVLVSRDETTGIATPKFGDGLSRRLTGKENETFSFRGESVETDENAWTLTFWRDVDEVIGGGLRK